MDKDVILYILYFIPVGWVIIFDQENLKDKKVFFKHLFISILLIGFGAVPEIYAHKEAKSLSYFGAQMLFIFLILYAFIRGMYVRIYNGEPEFSNRPEKLRDKIVSIVLHVGMISLPFIIDTYIIQKIF